MRALTWLAVILCLLAAYVFFVLPEANAQEDRGSMSCSDRADVLDQLGTKYKEAPTSIGLANNGGMIEVLTSTDGSTWTIILSMPNGKSCLLAAGEEWHSIERDTSNDGEEF